MDEIEKMDFKRLRTEVAALRDELSRMKRQYEDILYNLDDDNLGTVMKKEKDSVLEEVYPDGILKTSSIEHNADSIKTAVTVSYSKPETVQSIEEMTDRNVLYYLEPENLYYYWDPYAHSQNGKWIGEWASTTSANFGTVFEQTATGFQLKGNVAIDGSLIVSGDIEGRTISTQKAPPGKLYPEGSYIRLNSENNGLEFWYGDYKIAVWSVQDLGTTRIATSSGGALMIDGRITIDGNVTARGSWDFSEATVRLPGE